MSDAAVSYEVGLLEDLADPEEAAAYLDAALENGDREVIRMALHHVVEAQESSQVDDDLRFSPEGWLRFQALMAQAEESMRPGKTLSSDKFWRQVHLRTAARVASKEVASPRTATPAIAEPRVDYQTDEK
jgi:DNA-binding phage protein